MAKNMQKIAEVKLLSVDLKLRTSEKVAIARLWNCGVAVAEQHFFKSCEIGIAEVLCSCCGIAIADSKKSYACPHLFVNSIYVMRCNMSCNSYVLSVSGKLLFKK